MQELPIYVTNYLRKFGFAKWRLELSSYRLFQNIIVVPAIQESENIPKLLASLLQCDKSMFAKTLFIFVINNMESSASEVKDDNLKLLNYLRSVLQRNSVDELSKEIIASGMNVGVIDASSPGLEMPDKDGGVGYARKIGMDLALNYFDYTLQPPRILVCLDSDCVVSEYYLSALDEISEKKYSAGFFEYEHLLPEDDEEKSAIITYEIFLRYYVLGLKYANSPFAFDTIGSTMFCDAESYIRIGGMNKKKAAEDFYFLEKLAKITDINKMSSAKVFPSSRRSWRVPFGTGQRINRFFAGTHDEDSLYDPKSFEVLKLWLKLFFDGEILTAEEYINHAKQIDSSLADFLLKQSFPEAWTKIINETNKMDQLQKQKYFWFDGFRTLKLIHYLRDTSYPMVKMFDALEQLLANYNVKIEQSDSVALWQNQFEYLKVLRNLAT
ncbi:MAG: hypothetical protein Q8L04_08725 [Ignavibacteria bacterium]|nr:hypothetical protein [Ignavibacteria bacterium]